MQYQELASKIRAKYPGSYDDMDDRTLAQKIVAKYPDYSDTTFDDTPTPVQPSILDQAKGAYDQYAKTQIASPQDLLSRTDSTIRKGFGKVGEIVTEQMGRENQRNPQIFGDQLAGGVGTAISIAPDIASLGGPGSEIKGPKSIFRSVSEPMAQRSLGITKRFLNTPFARREANLASRVALEKDIIPMLGSPEEAFNRATKLASDSGSKIGKTLKGISFKDIAPDAELDLENFRNAITKGTQQGLFSGANSPIDTVKSTILEMYGRDLTANEYNEAKNILGNSLNYLSDAASQSVNKRLVNKMANTIKESVARFAPEKYEEFLANKRDFNASQMMLRGLNNEMAGQAGNNALSLPTMVAGAGQLAAGSPVAAASTLGATEVLRRRGAGIGARILEGANRSFTPELNARGGFGGATVGLPGSIKNRFFDEKKPNNGTSPKSIFKQRKPAHSLLNRQKSASESESNSGKYNFNQPNDNGNEQQNQNNGNGNFEGISDHILTESQARKYLKAANGDKVKAREMAKRDGWKIP